MHLFWATGFFGLLLIFLQAIFGLVVGHDGDTQTGESIDAHGGHGGGLNLLSLKSISAILLGFGFGGAIFYKAGFSVGVAALGGIVIGLVISLIYLLLMNSLYRLKSDGTSVLAEAVNRNATVYLRVPENMSGAGEIQVSFGGRMQNVKAYTRGAELPTGTAVRVVSLHDAHTLMVEKFS